MAVGLVAAQTAAAQTIKATPEELSDRIAAMQSKLKEAKKKKKASAAGAIDAAFAQLKDAFQEANGVQWAVLDLPDLGGKDLRDLGDRAKSLGEVAVALFGREGDGVPFQIVCTAAAQERGLAAGALAKELGALTVAVVTRPFWFEGRKRARVAEDGIEALSRVVDTLFVIPNERLFSIAGDDMSGLEAFKLADRVLLDAVRGLVELIHSTGIVNADFADVRTVMGFPGLALMGVGTATGDLRAVEAAQRAVSSPLLEEIAITGAKGILVNITSSSTLKLREMNEAVTLVYEEAHEDAEVVFGWVIDEALEDEVRVTVIATGFEPEAEEPQLPEATRPAIDRVLKVEPRAPRRPTVTSVTPWETVHGGEQFDLPPAVRQSRAEATTVPSMPLLERNPHDVLAAHEDDEMNHLDKPTYVRRLAD